MSGMEKALYSIGHGARKAEDFLFLLKKYEIKYLADVRSKPFSRFHPQFNRNTLELFLKENQITYIFMGDTLGGRPDDSTCWNENGKIDYKILKTKEYFKRGIDRLRIAYEKQTNTAIMCSERNPLECHRFNLIGDYLLNENIFIHHIDEKGLIKMQSLSRKNYQEFNLF